MINQAEIHKLAQSEEWEERKRAADILRFHFSDCPDKDRAWKELHDLSHDNDIDVRWSAAKAIGFAYSHIPGKDDAWEDFIRLIQDENALVRNAAVESFGRAFPHFQDKVRAWKNLHWTVRDVRRSAAVGIGFAYSHIPDKEMALRDLDLLAQDREKGVRIAAYYSLGKVSICKAAESLDETTFRIELEKALELFNESAQFAPFFNPARFSLPFYRSFHNIVFGNKDANIEIRQYLADMRIGVTECENKERLLEVSEKLAEALKEMGEAGLIDFETLLSRFGVLRRLCEDTADLIDISRRVRRGV